MRRLLPVLLALLGLLAGGGAGFLFRPSPEAAAPAGPGGEPATEGGPAAEPPAKAVAEPAAADPEASPAHEYVKLNNQFVVPVVENDEVAALVILSISLEVAPGMTEQVYAREPRLRDSFLRVLFDHANAGGFGGPFTRSSNMDILRGALLEVARASLGAAVSDVLIIDIVRQDS
ncbi:MAG: flagellar basal body-associated FliL family protein [Burkholderiales bacterium]|nr:flagellar basal body-associated FliL family protein [Burkholderiales bacterium]